MAETLHDLGSLVMDETLVINLLHGLNLLLEKLTSAVVTIADAVTTLYSGNCGGQAQRASPAASGGVPSHLSANPPSFGAPRLATNSSGGRRCR
jgi:hypothetical protein